MLRLLHNLLLCIKTTAVIASIAMLVVPLFYRYLL